MMKYTYDQALDLIASNPSACDREFGDKLAALAREVRDNEIAGGYKGSVRVVQAETFLAWYEIHKDELS